MKTITYPNLATNSLLDWVSSIKEARSTSGSVGGQGLKTWRL